MSIARAFFILFVYVAHLTRWKKNQKKKKKIGLKIATNISNRPCRPDAICLFKIITSNWWSAFNDNEYKANTQLNNKLHKIAIIINYNDRSSLGHGHRYRKMLSPSKCIAMAMTTKSIILYRQCGEPVPDRCLSRKTYIIIMTIIIISVSGSGRHQHHRSHRSHRSHRNHPHHRHRHHQQQHTVICAALVCLFRLQIL